MPIEVKNWEKDWSWNTFIPWCGSDTWQEKDRTGEWECWPVMQTWQSPRQLNGEPQTKDWPLEESLIGQKWPGPSSSTVLSHWLGASQEKSNLGLNIVVSFERTTARGCHLTALLSTEWQVLSWRKIDRFQLVYVKHLQFYFYFSTKGLF